MDESAAWIEWLDTVPVKDREEVMKTLLESDVSSFQGMSMFCQKILAKAAVGHVSPGMLNAMQPYYKMMMTSLFMAHNQSGADDRMFGVTVRQSTKEIFAHVKPVQLHITQAMTADVIDGPVEPEEPELLELVDKVDPLEP